MLSTKRAIEAALILLTTNVALCAGFSPLTLVSGGAQLAQHILLTAPATSWWLGFSILAAILVTLSADMVTSAVLLLIGWTVIYGLIVILTLPTSLLEGDE
jgi:hypothetical protein